MDNEGPAFRKDSLENKICELGIYLDEDVDWTVERLIKVLGDHYLQKKENVSWARKYMQSLSTVMLCHHLKEDIKNFKVSPLEMDEYVAEDKLNGFRCTIIYDPQEGFQLFSRKESVADYLNGEFTEKVLFINNGIIKTPKSYAGKFKDRFVFDCEITVDSEDASFEGVEYSSIEDFIQAVLGSSPERAQKFQKDGHKLIFNIFDVPYYETNANINAPVYKYKYKEEELTPENIAWVQDTFSEYLDSAQFSKVKRIPKKLYECLLQLRDLPKGDLRARPFRARRKIRSKVVQFMQKAGLPFIEVTGEDFYKMAYLDSQLREGKEGIILKNLDAPYVAGLKSSRSHRAWMKVKQTVSELMKNSKLTEDFDVFITGANPPHSNRIKDMIGALNCSIYIQEEDGTTTLHEVASVSGLNHEWKKKLALVDTETGRISLNPEYLYKVIPIDGLALTAGNLKFQHAVLRDKEGLGFKPKNATDCIYTRNSLESMCVVRGR